MIRIAVNGLGRLGRSIVYAGLQRDDIEIVCAHDIAHGEMLAYLFENDTMHSRDFAYVCYKSDFPGGVLEFGLKNNQSKSFRLLHNIQRENLNFGVLDVVIESSGKFLDSQSVELHLINGAKKVIISAPATDDTPTFILGVNEQLYNNEQIISNASCTSNALAPICKLLDSAFGIESGILSTIHSYTNDQNLLDNAHKSDKRRARTAALNIIPTTTGAAKALYKVLPNLKDRFHGHSVRVPVADVSMIDLNLKFTKYTDAKEVNALLREASKMQLKGILGMDSSFRVSSDFIGNTLSAIVAEDLTFTLPSGSGSMLKLMAWYDNETGYANRILDMSKFITQTR